MAKQTTTATPVVETTNVLAAPVLEQPVVRTTEPDDIQRLVEKATELALNYYPIARNHVARTMKKSSVTILCEFAYNKKGELDIKVVPKMSLPQESEVFSGEITESGALRIW